MGNSKIKKLLSLEDVLAGKEARQLRQHNFKVKYETTIVSITVNMPGPVKDMPILRRLRDYAVKELKEALYVVAVEEINVATGPEALVAVDADGWIVKNIGIKIEEGYSFSRLLDIDVFSADGCLLSRREKGEGRGCFVCGGETIVCMREQQHSQKDIALAVEEMLNQFKAYETRQVSPYAEKLGALALESMLFEVTCTPAPGLVDRRNNGAHRDMDFYSFMASSSALAMTMARCAQAGIVTDELASLLPVLRIIGLAGEQAMFTAAKGVNTQKGLLFLLGIMVGATGWLLGRGKVISPDNVLETARAMVTGIVERELMSAADKPKEALTAGEALYLTYGIEGIRGELAAGLPAVKEKALPALQEALKKGMSVNDALVQTLLVLMTCVDDTTVMHRHHPDKMRVWVREKVQDVLAVGGMELAEGKKRCEALDEEFINHNVSPGGVADLLAVTWFLQKLIIEEF